MSKQIAYDTVEGPQGKFNVSTIQTLAGGAPANPRFMSPLSESDYLNETPWPYETMVFEVGSSRGLYHEPHASEKQARDGHLYAVSHCLAGTLAIGAGVQGDFGVPSTTPEEWRDRQMVKP